MYNLSKGQKHAKRYSQEFKETLIDFYHSGQSVVQLSGLMSIKNIKN
ncbi:hypothetical protein LMG9446_1948 [Lactococcus lactis subsp. lactis]|nr:hypothetical protein LMG9446_1948 [Lactococcus lactis subsp. lactis]